MVSEMILVSVDHKAYIEFIKGIDGSSSYRGYKGLFGTWATTWRKDRIIFCFRQLVQMHNPLQLGYYATRVIEKWQKRTVNGHTKMMLRLLRQQCEV